MGMCPAGATQMDASQWVTSGAARASLERDVPHFQLHVAPPVELVDRRFDGEVDRGAGGELGVERGVSEGDALEARFALADDELEVVAALAAAARGGGDRDAAEAQHRPAVAVAEGAE